MIGYFEDEAVKSYTEYLDQVENGTTLNINAPKLAIEYYGLSDKAKLSDLIRCVRADEMHHSGVNHSYADDFDNIKNSSKRKDSAIEDSEQKKIA